MIQTKKHGDNIYLILSRCNNFQDHKSNELGGRDGDICFQMSMVDASIDVADAETLVRLIQQRLTIYEKIIAQNEKTTLA